MNAKGSKYLYLLMALLLAVSLACSGGANPPAAQVTPIQPNQGGPGNFGNEQPTAVPPQPTAENSNANSGGTTTFKDQTGLYQIEVPSDWVYKQVTGENYYIDQFKSPDGNALIENIVYDDGTTFNGGQKGKFALELIYRFYSATGSNKDITITGDQLQDDGSERLTWYSESGGYSAASYFETRAGRTTFLMFTIEWMNDYEDTYLDILNAVVASYSVP
ncbi:MAG: hypothetical protein HY867_08070 [Chloroflexi bacterium]|nr:hypothetical protein [Chloroflexota bacterium]